MVTAMAAENAPPGSGIIPMIVVTAAIETGPSLTTPTVTVRAWTSPARAPTRIPVATKTTRGPQTIPDRRIDVTSQMKDD
jgi:hypothetical protein